MRKTKDSRTARLVRRTRDVGFTLLEVMIVLAIIGMIAGGAGYALFNSFNKAKVKAARERIRLVTQAVQTYMIDNNSNCPKGLEELVSQKYLTKSNAKDPWGMDFVFRCPGQNDTDSADVISAGADKKEGTDDDIQSWDLQ